MCINRFDDDTKTSFLDLYSKVDSEVVLGEEMTDDEKIREYEAPKDDEEDDLSPF